STGLAARLLLLAGLALVVVLLAVALMRAGRTARADRVFQMLMDTTAQIRIRFAMVLLIAFVALAQGLGFEAILGAFLAGAVLRLIDADAATVHPHTELKLDAIGYGFLIPVFFITSGVMFDAKALFASPSTLLQVPLFLAALLMVRGLPALLYRAELGMRRTMAAGFLQATSLPFIVAAVQVGQRLGALPPASGAALIAAGLASVLLFPAIALAIMRSAPSEDHVAVPPLLGRRSPRR
ncbi:MAG TPA: cation:proton antiporter, partial [Pseudonocardiaceae bacterium]|nr:cation:proton antiporter [Pseudonocardiaceae bacterium]